MNLDVVIQFAKELKLGKDQPADGKLLLLTDDAGNVYKYLKPAEAPRFPTNQVDLFGSFLDGLKR